MTDATNPEPGVEADESAANPVEAIETDQADQETEGETSSETVEEFDEIEHDGERYQVPAKLKSAFMLNSDYTKKTQEVAEQRKAIEQQKVEFQKQSEAQSTNLKLHAEAYSIHQQLEQYKNLDWNKITDDDPVQAMKLEREYRTLKEAHAQRVHAISEYEQKRTLETQQEFAKRLEESRATIQKEIKGWSPELAQNLNSYGTELGFSMDEVSASVYDPRQVKVLHKAYLYDQLIKKQSAQKPPQPEAKPVAKITSGKSSSGPTEFRTDMSDADYDKWRAKQKRRSK